MQIYNLYTLKRQTTMNNILKQTIANMRQQPLLTGLTIAGTALAICLIMVVMMTREVQLVDYGNEPNRSRTLYANASHYIADAGWWNYDGALYKDVVNGIFLRLKTPEAVAVYTGYMNGIDVSTAGEDNVSLRTKAVNADFFRVFPLNFIEGKPFTAEECESNLPIAILSRSACRKVFKQEAGVKGREFMIANHAYRVVGVVDDVSPLLRSAHADIWVAATCKDNHPLSNTGIDPAYNSHVAILAKTKADFPKIKNEVDQLLPIFNKSLEGRRLDLMGQPDPREVSVNRVWSNLEPDMTAVYLEYLMKFIILLIVPAINIASMTQSRMRQRREEIGIRRAYGATRSSILWQVFVESLLQTLAAGVLGLLLCFTVCLSAANYIFPREWYENDVSLSLDPRIFFSPELYGWALLFCLVLNTLSSIVPAWRASRGNIVEALK